MEHVQGNPEIEERLANLAAGMQCAGRELDSAQFDAAERYDIGGDDDWGLQRDNCTGHNGGDGDGGMDMGGGGPKGGTAAWRSEGPGRWARTKHDHCTGPTPAKGPQCTQGAEGACGSATAMAAAAAGPMDAAPGGPGASNKRGAEGDADAKGALRQKTEADAREEADKKRAAELLQRQQQAIAAQQASHDAGAGGFGSETAQAVAAQQFIADVCKAVERARARGIEPRANGKELVEVTPMELRQWVADNLDDDDRQS